jgi:Holliday junction resolvase
VSGSERRKGVRGEAEVAALLRLHGFEVRGLEFSGDHLALGFGLVFHVECKRQEVARPWLWGEQALREAPAGTIPLVAMRRNRSPWYALVPLAELLGAIGNAQAAR